jgi:FkbM family methyltransferase
MLIPFKECCQICPQKIRGIIHIGAHDLEELYAYILNDVNPTNIIWIDAIKEKVIAKQNQHNIHHLCVSDTDNEDVVFHITNNGQSSSVLDFGTHKNSYQHIKFIKDVPMKTTRMDTFIKNNNIDITRYNMINIDIQGLEGKALKGFGDFLQYFDCIYTEVNTQEVYINCAKIWELDEYLNKFGFKRIKTVMWGSDGWGDAIYIKES